MKTDEQIRDIYKKWCAETKRSGGVLVGSSIQEFFNWSNIEGYSLTKQPPLKPLSELTEEDAIAVCRMAAGNINFMRSSFHNWGELAQVELRGHLVYHDFYIDLTNGDIEMTSLPHDKRIVNQAQIIKYYMDKGYDIFGQNRG